MFLDIGIGILLTLGLSRWLGLELTNQLLLMGIGFALLPDADVFVELWQRRGKLGGKIQGFHRTFTHYPLMYLPLVLAVFIKAGGFWALFLGLGALAHLLHDSVGTGWGIKWLWPFSKERYKFFADKRGQFSTSRVVSWLPGEWEAAVSRYGDPEWFKHYYLRPSPVLIVELSFFVISLLSLLFFKE